MIRLRSALLVSSTFALASACGHPNSDEGDADSVDEAGDGDGDTTDDGESGDTGEELRPNWHQDIAPLVTANCVGCHVEGGIAPFSMASYAQASPWASLM